MRRVMWKELVEKSCENSGKFSRWNITSSFLSPFYNHLTPLTYTCNPSSLKLSFLFFSFHIPFCCGGVIWLQQPISGLKHFAPFLTRSISRRLMAARKLVPFQHLRLISNEVRQKKRILRIVGRYSQLGTQHPGLLRVSVYVLLQLVVTYSECAP